MAEDAGEGSVVAWMRNSLPGRHDAAIGRDHRLRVPHDPDDVLLLHRVEDAAETALLLQLERELRGRCQIVLVLAALGQNVGQTHSVERWIPLALRDHDVLRMSPTAVDAQAQGDAGLDACSRVRVAQARQ